MIQARFLPKYPKRIQVSGGLTKTEAGGVVSLGFDYQDSEFGIELQQAVATTAADAASTSADRTSVASDAASAAASAAEAATSAQTTEPAFNTVADAEAATVPAAKKSIRTTGYSIVGYGGAQYVRTATEPVHDGKLRTTDRYLPDGSTSSTDGGWWELKEPFPDQYMFGALSDSSIDSTTAIKALHAYCELVGAQYLYAVGDHKITDTITIRSAGNASAATFYCDAISVTTAVRVGSSTNGDYVLLDGEVRTPGLINTAKTVAGWSGFANSIGVQLANLYHSAVHITKVQEFGIGLDVAGYGTGSNYCNIFLHYLWNNMVNIRLKAATDDGWSNENNFFGGRCGHDSSEGTNVSGVRQVSIEEASATQTAGNPNNNRFYGVSLEGNVASAHAYVQGSYTIFFGCRWEASPPRIAVNSRDVGSASVGNIVIGGYNAEGIIWSFLGTGSSGNGLITPRKMAIDGNADCITLATGNGNDRASGRQIAGYPAGVVPLQKDYSSSDWTYLLYAQGLSGKRTADTYDRFLADFNNGRLYLGDGSAAPTHFLGGGGSSITCNADFIPAIDNTYQLGGSGARFSYVYATSGTVSTSDAREKEWRGSLTDAEMRVARRLSKLIGVYRWLDAIEKKGDGARLHVGVTAQAVQEAFAAEGLDGLKYGVLCYDEWDAVEEKDGVPARAAGNRYGIRYDELWGFVAAGFEARLAVLEGAE